MHRPAALSAHDFWPTVRAETQSFTEQDGWWPHILWQALFGEWCGGSAVVLCPSMAGHMATMQEHVYDRAGFEALGARSPMALCWFTGVLGTVHQLHNALSIASDEFMHRGAAIVHADLLNTQEVHDMLASGWRTSEVFKLRLQRVWKCVRMPSIRKVRVCILHQYTEDPPAWLTCWDDERGSRGPKEIMCPYGPSWSAAGGNQCPHDCGFTGSQKELTTHTCARDRALEGCVSSFLESDEPHQQGVPQAVAALLRRPMLSGWYDRDSPQEQQAQRTGLLPVATTDVWFAMGWTTKQIAKIARQFLMARARWIDGISVVRGAVEKHIYHVGQRVTESAPAHGGPQWLTSPLYTQNLGFAERTKAKTSASPKTGWVGAAQMGPFEKDDIGRGDGLVADSSAVATQGRTVRVPMPSFESLMRTDEKELGCLACGSSPSWSVEGEALTAGGWCLACTVGVHAERPVHQHCENCGVTGDCWEWVMVADHDFVCTKCAAWYIERAPHARLWAHASGRRARIRRVVRWLLPADLPKGVEGMVSAVTDEVLAAGGAFSLVPVNRGPMWAWGWMPGVVAVSAAAHPELDVQLLGTDETRGVWLAQAHRLLHDEHEDLLDLPRWSDVWAWRLDCPAVQGTQQVTLARYWPQADTSRDAERQSDWVVPDCFSLHAVTDDVQELQEFSSAASLPGRGVNTSAQKQCEVYGCEFKVEDDFCDEHGQGKRELFMCDACHNGSHYECIRRVGANDELEGMLDANEGWRCRTCVTGNRFGVSTLLDSLVGDDGQERLLIRWYKPPGELDNGQTDGRCHGGSHGRCTGSHCDAMADISIGTSQDIGHDFAGLKEDLVRRQAARSARGADRYWRIRQYLESNRVRKEGTTHTRSWSRWDARHLDPRRAVWAELSNDQEQYEDWRWQHPALRMTPLLKRLGRWWPQHSNFTHARTAQLTDQHTLLADQWEQHVRRSLIFQWHAASVRRSKFLRERSTKASTGRRNVVNLATFNTRQRCKLPERITCPGVGCTANEFSSAISAELQWWPTVPLRAWAISALGYASGDTAQDHWHQVAQRCADMSLLQMRQWAELRLAAVRKGVMTAAQDGAGENTDRTDSVVVLLGDREFLACEDEVRVVDLYTCGVHMGAE